jgi:signal transduction histidine kinase
MTGLLRRSLDGRATVAMALEPGLWPVMADRTQLQTAVLNLVVNARDAVPTPGEVRIETRNANLQGEPAGLIGAFALIAVSDNGCGMSPETLAHVFEPFFTTKPPDQGTGLGLATVYGFVKQCGGGAAIESQIGKGTVVRLYLPRAAAGSAA